MAFLPVDKQWPLPSDIMLWLVRSVDTIKPLPPVDTLLPLLSVGMTWPFFAVDTQWPLPSVVMLWLPPSR